MAAEYAIWERWTMNTVEKLSVWVLYQAVSLEKKTSQFAAPPLLILSSKVMKQLSMVIRAMPAPSEASHRYQNTESL